jgi:hypothetical protein
VVATVRCGYLVEDGYQHAWPVALMQRVLPAPVFALGPRIAQRLGELAPEVVVGRPDELVRAIIAREIQVVFSTSQNIDPDKLRAQMPGVRVVFLGHGESDKVGGPSSAGEQLYDRSPINDRFDLVLLSTHEHLARCRNPNRELVGHLRHDHVVRERLAERAPVPDRVLWAPAFGRHCSIPTWLDVAIAATARLGLRLVIHLHPFAFRREPELARRVQVEVLAHRHVRLARVLDLVELMATSAIFLGDVSSASWDWLMFDRPAVFLDHPGITLPEEKRVFEAGVRLDPGADLEAALRAELAAPAARSEARRAALHARFYALDGNAATRVREATERWWRERWSA